MVAVHLQGWPVPGRLIALALAQLTPAVYCTVVAIFVPTAAPRAAESFVASALLVGLALVTVAVVPRDGVVGLYVVLALTAVIFAYLTGIRATGQNQIVFGLFLIMLCVWMASFIEPVAAAVLIAFASAAYLIALIVDRLIDTPVPAGAVIAAVVFTSATILHSRAVAARYERLVDNNADVILYSTGGRMTWVSSAVEPQFGWTPQEFIAHGLDLPHPDDSALVEQMRDRIGEGLQATGTYRLRCKDGRYRWVEARLSPLPVPEGRPDVIGTVRDVEDRVAAEQALAESTLRYRRISQRLQRSESAATRRFQDMSHELRTPLTVIRGPLERRLRQSDELPDGLRADLEAAVRASRRLEALVNQVLDEGSRAASDRAARSGVDVARVTADSVALLRGEAEAAGLTLQFDVADGFPASLPLDSEAWISIVLNLLSNAVKYTETGGVDVGLAYVNDSVVLAVADSGCGIAEDQIESVFDRFHVVPNHSARGHARSGLGLAVAALAAKRLGGRIEVRSAVDQGSVFTVTIPTGSPAPGAALRGPDEFDDAELVSAEAAIGEELSALMVEEGLPADEALAALRARLPDSTQQP